MLQQQLVAQQQENVRIEYALQETSEKLQKLQKQFQQLS